MVGPWCFPWGPPRSDSLHVLLYLPSWRLCKAGIVVPISYTAVSTASGLQNGLPEDTVLHLMRPLSALGPCSLHSKEDSRMGWDFAPFPPWVSKILGNNPMRLALKKMLYNIQLCFWTSKEPMFFSLKLMQPFKSPVHYYHFSLKAFQSQIQSKIFTINGLSRNELQLLLC